VTGDQCGSCKGKCLVADKKTFDVHIDTGMKHGSKIVLRGEAGCSEPGLAPGDIILVVVQKEHDVFQRAGVDLVMEKTISLTEALTGCTFNFKHLDGRVLRVVIPLGTYVEESLKAREEGIFLEDARVSKLDGWRTEVWGKASSWAEATAFGVDLQRVLGGLCVCPSTHLAQNGPGTGYGNSPVGARVCCGTASFETRVLRYDDHGSAAQLFNT
jgi:hypothetical protein